MVKALIKKLITYCFSVLYSYLILSITRIYISSYFLPTYIALDLFLLMILYAPTFLFRTNIASRIYKYLIISFISFLFLANATYYEASGTMLHLGLLKYMGEAKGVFDISYIKWYLVLYFIGFIIFYIIVDLLLNRFVFNKILVSVRYYIFGTLSCLILISISLLSTIITYKRIYNDNSTIANSAKINNGETIINFYTKYLRNSSLDNYGLLTFYLSNYKVNYLNADCGEKITSISENKNVSNKFHGLLEGYNIFTIMIETGISEMISEEYTPNLYYLMHNGLNFSNNYNKDKTSVAEIVGFTGSYPLDAIDYNYESGTKHCVYDLKINTPYAITNILGDSYYKSFFHDGVGYYARNSLIGQFGFDSWKHEFYNVHSYQEKSWDFDGSYELDSDYIDIVLDEMYKTETSFYTFWTTLSTHGPYEEYQGKTAVGERDKEFEAMGYYEIFDKYYNQVYGEAYPDLINTKYYYYLKHLTCAFMNLDEAVGKIINKLKECGVFDKTIFVIYGDHDAYYHQSSTNPGLSRILTNSNSVSDVRQYKTVLFFYNETLTDKYREVYELKDNEPCETSTFTSTYIIVPTLLDLLGYDYESEYYYSSSYFDFQTEYDGIFYSNELGAFFTDKFYSISPGVFTNISSELLKADIDLITEIENVKLLKLKTLNDYYKNWFYFLDED